jgi:CRP/FNR family cyclic AMP-dependent transcriptional regulator
MTIDKKFARRRTIFSQGDIAESVVYIQTGRMKLTVTSMTDKEAVVAILGPGDFFGEWMPCRSGYSYRDGHGDSTHGPRSH